MTSSSGLRGHRKTYLAILESAGHALFKMVRYVLLRPLRPVLEVIQNNCRVRFVGISQYVHFSAVANTQWSGDADVSQGNITVPLYSLWMVSEKNRVLVPETGHIIFGGILYHINIEASK
jgi:hypothetical protein